jgi:hypothetical protein
MPTNANSNTIIQEMWKLAQLAAKTVSRRVVGQFHHARLGLFLSLLFWCTINAGVVAVQGGEISGGSAGEGGNPGWFFPGGATESGEQGGVAESGERGIQGGGAVERRIAEPPDLSGDGRGANTSQQHEHLPSIANESSGAPVSTRRGSGDAFNNDNGTREGSSPRMELPRKLSQTMA